MRVTLIYNPNAGSSNEQPSEDDLIGLIRKAGHTVFRRSSKDNDLDKALEDPGELVVVAGGDGTVGKVAKNLIGKGPAIAILPMGTANNIATTLGISNRAIEELVAEWTSARRMQFDVGEANGPWGSMCFIEGFGIGLFSETMSRLHATDNVDLTHLDNTQIKITSILEILKERLRDYAAKNLKITLDGRDISGAYILLEALNIKYIGPNLHLAPGADPGDGFLDIVSVSEDEKDQLGRYLSDLTENELFRPGWTIRKGRHLQIEWDGFSTHIDDQAWPEKDSNVPPAPAVIDVQANRYTVEFLTPG
jgi:diacylglycerol kinase (ATP)